MQFRLCGTLVKMVAMVATLTFSTSNQISSKSLCFLHGGKVLTGVYLYTSASSLLRCSQICLYQNCYLMQWDPAAESCGLLASLDYNLTILPASPTLKNYYACGWNNKRIVRSLATYKWPECKTYCEDLGGRLFMPQDNTYAGLLNHVFQVDVYFAGMYRYTDNATTWYDMDGRVVTSLLQWETGQPNNSMGIQYYIAIVKGFLGDVGLKVKYPCACEV
ncbi:uncharacterized protein [Macrobrachium rosenbergii]|uniref:uncharacterized protein n=1 Tax=Macrobrachium rosenbergii TaxID=79674 RepID=UPI0034D3DB1D